jgi:hypothetical protein
MDNELIERRRSELDKFVEESFSVIIDFADRLGINNPHEILMDFDVLKKFMFVTVNDFMKTQTVNPDDRVWIITRMGYLMGEYFKEKYSGYWTVNDNQNSNQYGKYVVFAKSPTLDAQYPVDAFGVAVEFVDQTGERDLIHLITEIEDTIK